VQGAPLVHTAFMQPIHSSIDIDAPAALVWAILADVESYKRWNPFLRVLFGKPGAASALGDAVQRLGPAVESPGCSANQAGEARELCWCRRHLAPGLYTTEHRFRIEPRPAGGVRFHQTEQIKGLFASLLGRGRRRATEEGFHAMNYALKARAERMHEDREAAAASPESNERAPAAAQAACSLDRS
jgi:hypothetical protein